MDKKNKQLEELEPTIIESGGENYDETIFSPSDEDLEKTKLIKKTIPAFAWLVCIDRKLLGQRFDVHEGITSIGRGSENDIVLEDESVSKAHSKIKYFEDQDIYKIHDLVSTNGTFVNDIAVEGPLEIKDNDIVTIGEVKLIFKRVNFKDKGLLKKNNSQNE
ncbi:MAG: FHA domain-containing protein [Caldisericia bacterium]|nr:FHA domain-containing protein [Caldisericia bacterium]